MREIDLAAIRARLAGDQGKTWWRGLEELADTDEFRELLHREFPEGASELDDPTGRRQFLKLMGASLALAGVTGCTRQPAERIVPYVRAPEEVVPGRPLFFATTMPFAGAATPVLVESHMGRPTKIEPNPEHPSTQGIVILSSILSLLVFGKRNRLFGRDVGSAELAGGRGSWANTVAGLLGNNYAALSNKTANMRNQLDTDRWFLLFILCSFFGIILLPRKRPTSF